MYRLWNAKSLEVVTKPVNKPVSLALAKTHLRVDGTDEDTIIQLYIDAATVAAENYLKRALITQTLKMTMDGFVTSAKLDPAWSGVITGARQDYQGFGDLIQLWRAPIQSITSVVTIDESNNSTTYSASKYTLDKKRGRLFLNEGNVWPTSIRDYAGVEVNYVAGYGDSDTDVPENIRMGILQHVAQMYERCQVCDMPDSCKGLMGSNKIVRL